LEAEGPGTIAKECNPLRRTAILWFWGAAVVCPNDSTLPVPFSGSNDCANAGATKVVSTAKVVRNFFMSLLLWIRLKDFRETTRR
jgi:hypothetical protein